MHKVFYNKHCSYAAKDHLNTTETQFMNVSQIQVWFGKFLSRHLALCGFSRVIQVVEHVCMQVSTIKMQSKVISFTGVPMRVACNECLMKINSLIAI